MTHNGEKKFQCSQCDKHFNRKSNLKSHIMTHNSENKFQCSQCDKHFNTKKQSKKTHYDTQ